MEFQMLIATVKSELTPVIVKAAKKAGAPGSTVLPGHGTGIHEAKSFFGLELDVTTDMIMFLLEANLVDDVLNAISEKGCFDKPGTGIAFVMPVLRVVGMREQMPHFQRLLKRHDTATEILPHQLVSGPR